MRRSTRRSHRTRTMIAGLGAATALVSSAVTPAVADAPSSAATGVKMTLPAPTGRHPVGTVSLHLVDRSRHDSLKPSQAYRELMVSVWYPAKQSRQLANLPLAPQMPPLAAADWDKNTASDIGVKPGEVDWASTMTHARVGAPVDRMAGSRPVILYSPGLDGPRTLGTALVEELASRGYVVVTVDHTYEPDQVEFPGGRVERGMLPEVKDEEEQKKMLDTLLETRTADMKFVLNQLTRLNQGQNPDAERTALPVGLRGGFDLSRVGMFGHSFGGATAAQLAHDDRRVDAGIDLDGILWGPVVQTGVAKPFLMVSGGDDAERANLIPSWKPFWEKSTGWKREARFTAARHLSFCDLQVMIPQIAPKIKDVPIAELIGTIDPDRSIAAQRAYVNAFFDLHLRGRKTQLFDGDSTAYPEVKIVS